MLDSTGSATNITVATNFAEGRYDGTGPELTMLRATLTDFGRGSTRAVTISGLEADGIYDIWLVSHRQQSGSAPNYNERQLGTWNTANTTTSPSSQLVDGVSSGATPQGNDFVAGVNYALFQNVVANASGQIVFTGQAATIAAGFDDNYRIHLNGLQIIQVPEATTALLGSLGLLALLRRRRG